MLARTIIEGILIALSAGIVAVHVTLYVGVARVALWRRKSRKRLGAPGPRELRFANAATSGGMQSAGDVPVSPSITVVVPARNEEANLPHLFASLECQSRSDFSIVFVDDRSTDRTPALLADWAARHPGRVRLVRIDDAPPEGQNPKQLALAAGCAEVASEVILFTDADCLVPERWVEETSRCYLDPRVGLVIGAITTRQDRGAVSRFHAFDHLFKYGYTAGTVGIGMPTGGFGNNLSIRAAALRDAGGFESLGFSTTEDAALIAAIRTRTRWRVCALFDRATLVVTEPLASLAEVAAQEVRWHVGGLFSDDPSTRLSYGYLMLYLTASVAAAPFIPLYPFLGLLTATSFVTMGIVALLSGLRTKQSFRRYWLCFVPNLLFTMLFNSYLTVRALASRRVTWKGSRM